MTTELALETTTAKEYFVYFKMQDGKYIAKEGFCWKRQDEPELMQIAYYGTDLRIHCLIGKVYVNYIWYGRITNVQIVDGELFVMNRATEAHLYNLGFFQLNGTNQGFVQCGVENDIKPEQRLYVEFPSLKPILK